MSVLRSKSKIISFVHLANETTHPPDTSWSGSHEAKWKSPTTAKEPGIYSSHPKAPMEAPTANSDHTMSPKKQINTIVSIVPTIGRRGSRKKGENPFEIFEKQIGGYPSKISRRPPYLSWEMCQVNKHFVMWAKSLGDLSTSRRYVATSSNISSHWQNHAKTSLLVARNDATSRYILSHRQNITKTSLLVARTDATSTNISSNGRNLTETSLLVARCEDAATTSLARSSHCLVKNAFKSAKKHP